MQFENRKDLTYIAESSDYDLRYAAIVDETGKEVPITQQMIDRLYDQLCAEKTIRHILQQAV